MKAAGSKIDNKTWILASALDRLTILVWQNTKDGAKGRNKPASVVEALMDVGKPGDAAAFETGEEFTAARNRILKRLRRFA